MKKILYIIRTPYRIFIFYPLAIIVFIKILKDDFIGLITHDIDTFKNMDKMLDKYLDSHNEDIVNSIIIILIVLFIKYY